MSWTKSSRAPRELCVAEFNVLADGLDTTGKFIGDPERIKWGDRFPLLLTQITDINPDVIGLVECNNFRLWELAMNQRGYSGVFTAKRDSPAQKVANAEPDGVAVFWQTSKYKFIRAKGFDADPVQQTVVLQPHNDDGNTLNVSVIHLKAKPENAETRSRQIQDVLDRHKGMGLTNIEDGIIMGDFNAEPSEKCVRRMESHFGLSGYDLTPDHFTTWKTRTTEGEVKRCIDYIFASRYLTPSMTYKTGLAGPFPTAHQISDHVPIAVKFIIDDED
jgi:endonuclease/exonuclease/phosphatase family metal-dependent hydrolase